MQSVDLQAFLQFAVAFIAVAATSVFAVRRAAARFSKLYAAGAMSIGAGAAGEDDDDAPSRVATGDGQCAACGAAATRRCTGCMRVRYCSQECQSEHWGTNHRTRCKQLSKISSPAHDASKKTFGGFGPITLQSFKKPKKVLYPYDEFLKLYKWECANFVPCGLLNGGNSCFVNVVLQCLSCTKPLVAYLFGQNHRRDCGKRDEDWCFLCELQVHVTRVSQGSVPFYPDNILSRLTNIGGNLECGRQEDAHEFMRFAIDKMQSACLDEYGGEKNLDHSMQETSLIQHMFGGHLQSQVRCTNCGMVSNRYDNMMDLTVEIQGDVETLEDCLVQFTAKEWLDGDNKYKCDGCNDYVKAWKRLTVYHAPNILTITLKRFQSGRFGKINKRITFPLRLDLSPFMSCSDGEDMYELYAVVVHLDMLNASFFGHYICYTKDSLGRWYRVDDCKVMLVEEAEVLAQGAYMLLYDRKTARPHSLTTHKDPPKKSQASDLVTSNDQKISSNCKDVSSKSALEASASSIVYSLPSCFKSDQDSPCNVSTMEFREVQNMQLDGTVKDADNDSRAYSSLNEGCKTNYHLKLSSNGSSDGCSQNNALQESACLHASSMNCQETPPWDNLENLANVSLKEHAALALNVPTKELDCSYYNVLNDQHESAAPLTACVNSREESFFVGQQLSVNLASLSGNASSESPGDVAALNCSSSAFCQELDFTATSLSSSNKTILDNNPAAMGIEVSGTHQECYSEAHAPLTINGSPNGSLVNGFGKHAHHTDTCQEGPSLISNTANGNGILQDGTLSDDLSPGKQKQVSVPKPHLAGKNLLADERDANPMKSCTLRAGKGDAAFLPRGFLSKSYSKNHIDGSSTSIRTKNHGAIANSLCSNTTSDTVSKYAGSPASGANKGGMARTGSAITSSGGTSSLANGSNADKLSHGSDSAEFSFMPRGFLSTKHASHGKALASNGSSACMNSMSCDHAADGKRLKYPRSYMGFSASDENRSSSQGADGAAPFSEESSCGAKNERMNFEFGTAYANGTDSSSGCSGEEHII